MSFWLQVAVLFGTVLSLVFHHFHNSKLNKVGDAIDKLEALAPKK